MKTWNSNKFTTSTKQYYTRPLNQFHVETKYIRKKKKKKKKKKKTEKKKSINEN